MNKIICFFKSKKNTIFAGIAIVLIAALITAFITFVLPGIKSNFSISSDAADSPDEAVTNYYVALNTKNFDLLCNCYTRETAEKLRKISENYTTTDEFFQNRIDNGLLDIYGENVEFTVSNLKNEPQEISEDGMCNGVNVKEKGVEKVVNVTAFVNTKGSKFESRGKTLATVYNIDGKWYIVGMKDINEPPELEESTDSAITSK